MMSRSKPLNDLSLDAFRLALSIVEGPSLKVSGARLTGATSTPFKGLRDLGALVHKERATTIICQECHRRHRATVTYDRERQATTYFCIETGRVAVEPAQLDIYEFQLDWLLDWIAKAHHIAVRQRSIPRVQDYLWEVGEATIEGYRIRIFFARQIGSPQILERLEQRLLSLACKGKTGVVLTASAGLVVPRRLPSAISIVHLSEVIEIADKRVSIDRQRLLGIVEPEATVDRYKTGLAGRPTAKHLLLSELERRIKSSRASIDRQEEAEYLKSWIAEHHPDAMQPTTKTILNNIADKHRTYRTHRL